MATKNITLTCKHCGNTQSFNVKVPNHLLHAVLSLATGGFWLIIWGAAAFETLGRSKPKCYSCKKKLD